MNTNVPVYYLKVLTLAGTVLAAPDGTFQAAPLPVADLTFSEILYRPGQKNLGEMTATLLDIRDPRYMQYRDLYFQLNYEQRLEVYTNIDCIGTPVWTGVLTRLPNSLEKAQIAGQGILRRLDTRRLYRYQSLSGNASTQAQNLLKAYDLIFSDNFNRVSIGDDWTIIDGTWAISSNALTSTAGAVRHIKTTASYTAVQWGITKVSFNVQRTGLGNDSGCLLQYQDSNNNISIGMGYVRANGDEWWVVGQYVGGVYTSIANRYFTASILNEWRHVDIYTTASGSNTQIVIIYNGMELFNVICTGTSGFAGNFVFTGSVLNYDNFLLCRQNSALVVGTFDTTTQNITQTFNNNTQLEALNWIADYMGWEYRVNAAAGAGNDTIDFGASVGTNLSSSITLQEGANITDMSRDRTSQDLATSLYVYGQVQDDTSANFISTSIAQMAVYGIIEKDYNNPMVVDSATAKVLGDNRLAVMSAGSVSLSGTAIDESVLFEKASQNRLRAGDTVTLVSPSLNINKTVRIVQVDRTSGTPLVKLTFDYFPYRQTDAFRDLMQQYWDLRRGFINRMNTQNIELVFASQTTQNWYVYLRGQIQAVYIDVRLNSGTPTYAILIDGTDRTNALFGSATLTADAHATDTTYLILSGDHTVGVQVSAGTGTLDLAIQTRILS